MNKDLQDIRGASSLQTVDVSSIYVNRGEYTTIWLRPNPEGALIQVELHITSNGIVRIVTRAKDADKIQFETFDTLYK